MKIRIQEIELGARNISASKEFYQSVLGMETALEQANLNVFRSGIKALDFNVSAHLPDKTMVISFLTDDIKSVIDRLNANGISFDGPRESHLGMSTVEFKDPDGYPIRVNQPGEDSPSWLTV